VQPRIVGDLQPEEPHIVKLKRKRWVLELEGLWRMPTTRRPMLARGKEQEQTKVEMREVLVVEVERRILQMIARELA